jgi:uncharacterized protein
MTNRLAQFWLIFILSFGGRPAEAQTVDCATAQGPITRAVCSDSKLQQLNRNMREVFRKSLLDGDKGKVLEDQKNWLRERNKICANKLGTEVARCIELALTTRIQEIKARLNQRANKPPPTNLVASPPPSPPTSNPSCVGSMDAVDRASCIDPLLFHWHDLLATFYQQALNDAAYRSLLADDQRRWTGDLSKRCGSLPSAQATNCILPATKQRIEQLVQFIKSRDDTTDRASKIKNILAGKTTPPPGLDADSIDRESSRADQSEQILNDARSCIRSNVGVAKNLAGNADQTIAFLTEKCFADFSKRFAALELGPLAASSFKTLVQRELDDQK